MSAQDITKPIDKWIPWFFVMFFAVFMLVDAVFVGVALRTHTGTVSDQAYEKGLAYNHTLEQAQIQAALGWKMKAAYDGGVLRVMLNDRKGRGLDDARIDAHIGRAVQAGLDQDVTLIQTAPGIYETKIDFPAAGLWNVDILATWQKQKFYKHTTLTIPHQ